ncbi:hypothetical protein D3C86_1386630 [compost metagenome]
MGGAADQTFQLGRIALARRLDHDAVRALTGDGDFLGARAVQTATHDLDGLIHRRRAHAAQRGVRIGEANAVAAQTRGRAVRLAVGGDAGLGQLAQLRQRRVELTRIGDGDDHAARLALQGADIDLLFAQGDPHVFHQVGDALVAHLRHIDLEQEVGATLQVEAQVQAVLGQPAGQRVALRLTEHAREGQQQPDNERQHDQGDFPAR